MRLKLYETYPEILPMGKGRRILYVAVIFVNTILFIVSKNVLLIFMKNYFNQRVSMAGLGLG